MIVTRAISIRQPWAWLIVHGQKDVENRTWRTTYRGPVAIHASKTADQGEIDEFFQQYRELYPGETLPKLQRGGLIGVVNITDCVTRSTSEWFDGPFGFTLDDARPIPFVPMAGKLGIYQISPISA